MGCRGLRMAARNHLHQSVQDDRMTVFSVRMRNRLQFSNCDAPHIPTSQVHEELLIVALKGDTLTITELRHGRLPGSRIYAQRTVDLPGASTFMILPRLPSGVEDGSFFSALGTAVVFQAAAGAGRQLRAVGTDVNTGQCHGWIFDAREA